MQATSHAMLFARNDRAIDPPHTKADRIRPIGLAFVTPFRSLSPAETD